MLGISIEKIMNTRSIMQFEREMRREKREKSDLYERIGENRSVKNTYCGERCFIVGNGPSLLNQNLSLLSKECVFTVNMGKKIHGLKESHSIAHIFADPIFFRRENMNSSDEICDVCDSADYVFLESIGYEFASYMKKNENKLFFFKAGPDLSRCCRVDFSQWVSGASTVVHYAIELAIYMGFKSIVLLGCDTTNILSYLNGRIGLDYQGHAYTNDYHDSARDKFVLDYFDVESQLLGTARMFSGYRVLNDYCKEIGVTLVNATEGGLLDVLPRCPYNDFFINKE